MTRDSSKLSKREQVKRSNKKSESNLKKKKDESSDSEDGDSDSESDEMNMHELRKYIQKIFPSKHMEKKIKAGEKLKKIEDDDEEEENVVQSKKKTVKNNKNKKYVEDSEEEKEWETESEEEVKSKKNKKSKNKKSKKNVEESDEESDSSDSESNSEDEDDKKNTIKSGKFNIIFRIGGEAKDEDEYDDDEEENWEDEFDEDYEDYENSDDETEDEDEEVSTDESSDDEDDEEEDEEDEEEYKPKKKSSKNKSKQEEEEDEETEEKISKKSKKSSKKSLKTENENNEESSKPTEDKNEVLLQLKELLLKNPKDKSIEKCIDVYEENIKKERKKKEKKEIKQKEKNMRIFRKIIRDKNTMNDFSFYEKLETENQKKLIKELREINKITRIEKPYRMSLLESNIPIQFKAAAMKKVNSLRYMEPGSGEFYKIKNWVDTFMKIPFTNFQELPINIDNGVDKCHEFMENAQKTLDSAVYGLNDAKMQIMQMLGQLLTNPKAIGTAIAIHGPPGTGKTSLVKEGISKILNRPFAFIALGGATDSSFLEGHSYTYEGSTWGKIVQILIDSNCMNPVIYFDELDKISDTPRGEEIAGILTHLTDTSQNSQFHDKYFAEINFDLSKCLFIFSYNDESKVNPILRDRMYRIKTKGYSGKEKTVIANHYLLPKIREQVKFNNEDIMISDEVLSYINETHCHKEDGVRNMKRCLEIIHTKINLYRLMKPGSNLFEDEMSIKVEFPFNVSKDIVDKLIKKEQENVSALWSMYT